MSEKLEAAVKAVIEAGYQLSPDGLSFLEEAEDPERLVKGVLERLEKRAIKPMLLTRGLLAELSELPVAVTPKRAFRPYAKEVESSVDILKDPTGIISTRGAEEDFISYFRSRFEKLVRIIRRRRDALGATRISDALKAREGEEVKVLGLVLAKRETRTRIVLEVDDQEASAEVVILSSNLQAFEQARKTVLDQLVCIRGRIGGRGRIIADELIWPDIEERRHLPRAPPIYAALTSDLHVGSKQFEEVLFRKFLDWLRGRVGTERQRELAGRVKYVIIAGDLVDGVGVYPGQDKDLVIADLYEQYRVAARLLEEIPDYIELIIIPGNHDATQQALPQPAVWRKYAEPIYQLNRTLMLGNPSTVALHGVRFLIFHGVSLEDLMGSVPDLSYDRPQEIMRILLQVRHLAPIYGGNTLIAPEPVDHLVVEEVPDVFHGGHVHVNGYEIYRGVRIVNSGTWQSTTHYQQKRGIRPTPGRVPAVNLNTLEVSEISFA